MDGLDEILAQLPPEELDKLLHVGSLGTENELLQQQIEQAMALRRPSNTQHTTGIGAALGGMGDILRNVVGGIREGGLRDQQTQNMGEMEMGRKALLHALRSGGISGMNDGGSGVLSAGPATAGQGIAPRSAAQLSAPGIGGMSDGGSATDPGALPTGFQIPPAPDLPNLDDVQATIAALRKRRTGG